MKKLLIGLAAAAALGVAAPASAQVYFGADPGGVGVQVGPLGVGVGPRYYDDGWRHRHRGARHYGAYAYDDDCRIVKSRVHRNGRVIVKTRQICD